MLQLHVGTQKIEHKKYEQKKNIIFDKNEDIFTAMNLALCNKKPYGLWSVPFLSDSQSGSSWIDFWYLSEKMAPPVNINGSLFVIDNDARILNINSVQDFSKMLDRYPSWETLSNSYDVFHVTQDAIYDGRKSCADILSESGISGMMLDSYDIDSFCILNTNIVSQIGTFKLNPETKKIEPEFFNDHLILIGNSLLTNINKKGKCSFLNHYDGEVTEEMLCLDRNYKKESEFQKEITKLITDSKKIEKEKLTEIEELGE